jgi:hypothetical protein
MPARDRRRSRARWPLVAGLGAAGLLGVAVLGLVMAITGASLTCTDTTSRGGAGPAPTGSAREQVPPTRLRLYQAAGRRFDVDWAFLASIGAQECGHGSCRGDNGYGCAGPMQIAVRRGSPCSPGAGPTLWDRFKTDGDHDGRSDVDDPADAIYTAARILRHAKGAPPAGGSFAAYRRAACNYYGACADASAAYADQVMARAIAYGLGQPSTSDADVSSVGDCGGLVAGGTPDGTEGFGPVRRVRRPRQLAALPASIAAGPDVRCDARIVAGVIWLARRFHVRVTACYAIHSLAGEHPLGAATDLVPEPGSSWQRTTEALARAAGWSPSCAASGVAPACARPPFRFIGYNGFPGHGDPAHCACGDGAHLHLSWLTSASTGQPENQPRTSHFAPTWIDTFDPTQAALDG